MSHVGTALTRAYQASLRRIGPTADGAASNGPAIILRSRARHATDTPWCHATDDPEQAQAAR